MNKEQAIEQYMKSLDISREEAEQLWEDDQADFIGEEGEQMTAKAKQIRRYEQADKPRKTAQKEKKIDAEKQMLIQLIHSALMQGGYDVEITNEERTIDFLIGDNSYTVTLTKHRRKKEK